MLLDGYLKVRIGPPCLPTRCIPASVQRVEAQSPGEAASPKLADGVGATSADAVQLLAAKSLRRIPSIGI